jgi:hypothetical protein
MPSLASTDANGARTPTPAAAEATAPAAASEVTAPQSPLSSVVATPSPERETPPGNVARSEQSAPADTPARPSSTSFAAFFALPTPDPFADPTTHLAATRQAFRLSLDAHTAASKHALALLSALHGMGMHHAEAERRSLAEELAISHAQAASYFPPRWPMRTERADTTLYWHRFAAVARYAAEVERRAAWADVLRLEGGLDEHAGAVVRVVQALKRAAETAEVAASKIADTAIGEWEQLQR